MTYHEDDKLYRRTQLLFKKRREARREALRKKADSSEKPKPTSPSELIAPQYPPSQTLGKYISRYTPYYYQPPKQPLPEDRPRSSKASQPRKTTLASRNQRSKSSSQPEQAAALYPPPSDTNYSQVPSQVPVHPTLDFDSPEHHIPFDTPITIRKFVDCEKCGKKNFSSSAQLAIHHQSKKCKNRQDRNTVHKCETCLKTFDTRHNLPKHNCRFH